MHEIRMKACLRRVAYMSKLRLNYEPSMNCVALQVNDDLLFML
jgi:hypothetical protein